MKPGLKQAVAWIAREDEPQKTDIGEVAALMTVELVATLWGKSTTDIARRVVALRRGSRRASQKLPPHTW